MVLDKVKTSSDIKKLTIEEMVLLAGEIRTIILKKSSEYGGHVGSNLGIVELTIALHRFFNFPNDKLVFDVSHQTFTHKILTGRKEAFINSDKYSDVSEFTNPNESEFDLFHIGHTSTSISLAIGLALSRQALGTNEKIIAVIGDAALGGGQAYEGLNIASDKVKGQFLIILNDNEMSVFNNQGSLYPHLKELRESKGLSKNNIFKCMGYDYHYLENGNDIFEIIKVLEAIENRPTVLHIHTKKGLGYVFAETNKSRWHFSKPFNLETGEIISKGPKTDNYGNITFNYLSNVMKKRNDLIVVTASTPSSIGFHPDRVVAAGINPNQFYDIGIEEQNLVLVAAGIAKSGGQVVIGTWASFYQRAYDQIHHEICLNKLPVTMLVTNASVLGDPNDTHAGIFDVAMFSSMPNLLYLAPAKKEEYLSMLRWSINQKQWPVAIRIPWHGVVEEEFVDNKDWSVPQFEIIGNGNTIALITVGGMYSFSKIIAKQIFDEFKIVPTLVNSRYAYQLDYKTLDSLAKNHSVIITIEDCLLRGGFGSAVSQYFSDKNIMVKSFGFFKPVPTEFKADQFMKENELSIESIIDYVRRFIEK